MRKLFIFLIILLGMSHGYAALLRHSHLNEPVYCIQHQSVELPDCFKDCAHLVFLIPKGLEQKKCWYIDCPKCKECYWSKNEDYDEDDTYISYVPYCDCKWNGNYGTDDWLPNWKKCRDDAIYPGYFNKSFIKYFSCFRDYLEYSASNQECLCFWPERSLQAYSINNIAYNLFKDLFETTTLSSFLKDKENQFFFFNKTPDSKLTLHGIVLNCVIHSFFLSDYDWICRDLEFYSQTQFDHKDAEEISIKLEYIRETLMPLFLKLYQQCLSKHPS